MIDGIGSTQNVTHGMAAPDDDADLVVSDLAPPAETGTSAIRFSLNTPVALWSVVDADGDLDPRRPSARPGGDQRATTRSVPPAPTALSSAVPIAPAGPCRTLQLAHSGASSLLQCGLQLWRGALLLADFLIHSARAAPAQARRGFPTASAAPGLLEIGAGCGLVSLIAAHAWPASRVFCTDGVETVLPLAAANLDRQPPPPGRHNIRVRHWDIQSSPWPPPTPDRHHTPSEYAWQRHDADDLSRVSVLLGADIVYDDALTHALVLRMSEFLRQSVPALAPLPDESTHTPIVPDRVVYLAVECRRVFTLAAGDCVPAVNALLHACQQAQLHVEIVDVSGIRQYVQYERNQELMLLCISS